MNPEHLGIVNGAWMPTVVVKPDRDITREHFLKKFSAEDIDARVFFHPLSSLPMFEPQPENTLAWGIPRRAINLPSFHDITQAELDRVIAVFKRCLDGIA
jgi:perosamine synthetase